MTCCLGEQWLILLTEHKSHFPICHISPTKLNPLRSKDAPVSLNYQPNYRIMLPRVPKALAQSAASQVSSSGWNSPRGPWPPCYPRVNLTGLRKNIILMLHGSYLMAGDQAGPSTSLETSSSWAIFTFANQRSGTLKQGWGGFHFSPFPLAANGISNKSTSPWPAHLPVSILAFCPLKVPDTQPPGLPSHTLNNLFIFCPLTSEHRPSENSFNSDLCRK